MLEVNYDESKTKHIQRNKILNQAFRLFLEKGIQNVTMQDIAEAAFIQRRTLYFYYKSKDDVALELIKCTMSEFRKITSELKIPTYLTTGFARIEFILNAYLDYFLHNEELILFTVHSDYYFHKSYSNEHEESSFTSFYEESRRSIQQELNRGIEDGSIKEKYAKNIEEIFFISASAILSLTQRLLYRGEIIKSESGYDRKSLSLLVDVILQGLKA
ncbi:TetR/AcrR family transcriptional regulator [Paenibacillus sp. OV219]|uniref:TetR/AcrR family transcriptional regulator n=1 Tax=Paenibacillus sp. OV219 TaxID=1884377 RepID=UPI0008D6CBC2|nr:TetR/AcrR family transcriptional regulator [Paenibacillus sp. OV219]SEM56080.1 transcriptional regulator, TetR family [Paenibacillus sp. OV219]